MIYLIGSIVLTSYLLLSFKVIERFRIPAFQAIVFNYITCVVTGSLVNGSFPATAENLQQPWALWLQFLLDYEQGDLEACQSFLANPNEELLCYQERKEVWQIFLALEQEDYAAALAVATKIPSAGMSTQIAQLVQLVMMASDKAEQAIELIERKRRLAGSGYFDSAFIFVDPEADPAAAPVQVTVREAPLQKLVLGIGFTTDGGPRTTAEHTHNRLPVIGWRTVTKLQAERKNPYAQTELQSIPGEDYWRWAVLARGERLDDDRIVTHSQRLRAGRFQNEDRIDRNVYVQYERATVQTTEGAPVPAADSGAGSALSANYVWTGRYFDNLQLPTSGYGVGFELGAGVTLGSVNEPFQRTILRALTYRPLGSGTLKLRAEAGAVFAKSGAPIPATQLFRTGGDTTVRGYKFLDIGVPLGDGLVGPGRYLGVASVEWQKPIVRRGQPTQFDHVVFIDSGAVADQVGDLRPKFGVGTGVRWRSPLGPVEASIAYGVQPREFRLHFTAGFVF